MLSDADILDLRPVLLAQSRLLTNLEGAVAESAAHLSDVAVQVDDIANLQRMMDDIESNAHLLRADDLAEFDPASIPHLYETRRASISRELAQLGYRDWPSFVRQCEQYVLYQGLDPLAPYEALLTTRDLERLRAESYGAELRWDRWDYVAVGISALLAVLTDVLLVGTPATSPLTLWLKRYDTNKSDDWFARWAQTLKDECKVPYDKMRWRDDTWIDGMSAYSHRFQTLGHDPVLGFVFGILDIMRDTVTGFSYEKLADGGGFHRWIQVPAPGSYEPVGLIQALLCHMGHLLSDVATSCGLPAPFMPLLQSINAGHFGKKDRTVGEVARYMYLKGYDLRHFLVAGLTPGVIEIVLRGYVMLRQYRERGEISLGIASSPKYRAMLLSAHGIAALANAGKVTLSGNVLGVNVAEWQALVRYLVPSLKYWVLDRHRIEMEHLERINEEGWEELLQNGNALLSRVLRAEADVVVLGGETA